VRITRPFYLGVYEVTQAQYEGVMGNIRDSSLISTRNEVAASRFRLES
jgi:formylglycine-generating enzyme required for sulfatase activity